MISSLKTISVVPAALTTQTAWGRKQSQRDPAAIKEATTHDHRCPERLLKTDKAASSEHIHTDQIYLLFRFSF